MLVLNLRWGDDESHLLNCLTWEATQLKSCCPNWSPMGWVVWGMLTFSSCMLPIMWVQCVFMSTWRDTCMLPMMYDVGQMKVFLTTWCHLGHMFDNLSAPMLAMGTLASYQVWWACWLHFDNGIRLVYSSPWSNEEHVETLTCVAHCVLPYTIVSFIRFCFHVGMLRQCHLHIYWALCMCGHWPFGLASSATLPSQDQLRQRNAFEVGSWRLLSSRWQACKSLACPHGQGVGSNKMSSRRPWSLFLSLWGVCGDSILEGFGGGKYWHLPWGSVTNTMWEAKSKRIIHMELGILE